MRGFIGGFLALGALFFVLGTLVADEDSKPGGTDPGALFDQLDKNHDGQISRDEVPEDKQRLFDRLLSRARKDKGDTLKRSEFIAGLKDDRPERNRPQGPGAGAGQPDPEEMFKRLDASGDGKITADEVPADRLEMFNRLLAKADKNGDGALSKEEFIEGLRALRGQPDGKGERPGGGKPGSDGRPDSAAQIFKRWDANGDGKLTIDEVPEPRRPMFERILKRAGKSGDQGLSEEEFKEALRGERPAGDRPAGDRPERRRGRDGADAGRGGPPPGRPGGLFAALDTDGDGELSEAEIAAAPSVLRKLDKNGDGKLSREEALGGAPPPPPPPREREDSRAEGRGRRFQGPDGPRAGRDGEELIKMLLKNRFDEIDTNGDGVIDRQEFAKHAERMLQRMGRLRDADQAGPRGRKPDGEREEGRGRDRRPPPPDRDGPSGGSGPPNRQSPPPREPDDN